MLSMVLTLVSFALAVSLLISLGVAIKLSYRVDVLRRKLARQANGRGW